MNKSQRNAAKSLGLRLLAKMSSVFRNWLRHKVIVKQMSSEYLSKDRRLQTAIICVVGLLMCVIHWQHSPVSNVADNFPRIGDPYRYTSQARNLRDGNGFVHDMGVPCTSLPPGYPVVLAGAMLITNSLVAIQWAQVGLFISASLLVFAGISRVSGRLGFLAAFLMVASPWASARATDFLSETFGLFLCSAIAFLLIRMLVSDIPRRIDATLIGIATLCVCLTTPYLTLIMLPLWLATVIQYRKNATIVLSLIVGALIPYVSWQAHCVWAIGRPVVAMLTPLGTPDATKWLRTWASSPREFEYGLQVFAWHTMKPDWELIPDHAFQTEAQKSEIKRIKMQSFESGDTTPVAEVLSRVGRERRMQSSIGYYIIKPIERGIHSWCDFQPVRYHSAANDEHVARLRPQSFVNEVREFGFGRAGMRAIRGVLSLAVMVSEVLRGPAIVHLISIALIGWCVLQAIRYPGWIPISVLLGIVFFTYVQCYDSPEYRRNEPVVPLLFFLGTAAHLRKRDKFTLSCQS